MSLTRICPLDVADGAGGCVACAAPMVVVEDVLVEVDDDDGVLGLFSMESEGCGDFLVLRVEKSGACRDICVVGMRAAKSPAWGVRGPGGVRSACIGIAGGVVASRRWWTEGEGKVCICEPLACGGSGCGGAREPSGDEDDRAAFVASGTSKGFGRSWPSALARGVSCSNTDGHNLIIALGSGKDDSEDRDEGGVG